MYILILLQNTLTINPYYIIRSQGSIVVAKIFVILEFMLLHSLKPGSAKIVPAMQALRNPTKVPATKALPIIFATSCLRCGARAPIDPNWIPMELTLAKLHRAYVDMARLLG